MKTLKNRQGWTFAREAAPGRQRGRRPLCSREEGQGLLESAVALMFLLLVLAAMFEMAIVFSSYIALLNGAVQGAIYAAGHTEMQANPPDEAYQQYTSIVQAEVLAGGLRWLDIGLHPPELPPNSVPGAPLTVTVDYTMTTMFSELVLPMFERFGLPSKYHISARTAVPIR